MDLREDGANNIIFFMQVTLTFHAGMEAIGYEWGTTVKHKQRHNKSPDHESHHSIAKVLSNYGGKFGSSNVYKYDTMNGKQINNLIYIFTCY